MSFTVGDWQVKQYSANVFIRAQQIESRLLNCVHIEPITSEKVRFDRLNSMTLVELTTRHQDTPLTESVHDNRWVTVKTYAGADMIDKADRLKMLHNPESSYTKIAAAAVGRRIDKIIIDAMDGSAEYGKDGGSFATFPAAQDVAVVGNALTLAQILQAKEKLDAAENDPNEERYFLCSARQIARDLLNTTEVKSVDYNTVKALALGQIDTFCGFKFIRSEQLAVDAATDRKCFAFLKSAIGFARPSGPDIEINKRSDKNNSTQIHVMITGGAVRIEDEKIVRVAAGE